MTLTNSTHILVFPYPAQGHMIALLDLTHQLVIRGLTITILVTPKNLPILNPLLSTHPTIQTLVLPFPIHPSIPPGVENTKDLPNGSFRTMMRVLAELSYPITQWFNSHPSPPVAILSDMFLGWTTNSQFNSRNDPNDENELIPFPNFPNSPNYPWYQLSNLFRTYVKGDPDSEFTRDGLCANMVSWGVIFNSFNELESVYLDHIKNDLGRKRVFAVGPLVPPIDAPKERGGSSSIKVNDLLGWLDTCSDRSVVYVCFGSQVVLNNRQMEELALGLEKSGTRFVWSVKEATTGHVAGEYGVVPSGFEDRVAGRGFVIKGWAPQVVILNHRAVGSFLTHCGWNSLLEAIIAGVPMLTWPMGADQYINSELLVERIGVAVKVCQGGLTVPNADELALKFSESVGENQLLSERAKELSQAALNAVKDGGSSSRDLDGLVRELQLLSVEMK
ncbi:hypothetical protein IFM89_004044 [Coptis chinensis]|uniref:Glycosyltransferase n=1 Tax=Coptis chinensis TaxID=261450 RepID=A0A835GVJ0_9MAGN|nr:hypothetical protein IFM89_004044 [Coptis chinensis]